VRKLTTTAVDLDRPQRRSTRRLIHLLFALCLGLLVVPIGYEIGAVSAANWKAMSGRIDHVDTPVLDSVRGAWTDTVGAFRRSLKGAYRQTLPWRPSLVIALGFAWALFMGFPLRRSQ
jgi:hypothetical protein